VLEELFFPALQENPDLLLENTFLQQAGAK